MPIVGKAVRPLPVITSFDPASGYEDDVITVEGSGFVGTVVVQLGLSGGGGATTVDCPDVTVVSPTELTFVVPPDAIDASGTGEFGTLYPRVLVSQEAGSTNSGSDRFTPLVLSAAPVISSLSAYSGVPGDSITATGTDMGTVTSFRHNGVEWDITGQTGGTVTATVPEGAAFVGPVTVENPDGEDDSADFTLNNAWYELLGATVPPGATLARVGEAAMAQTGTTAAAAVAIDTPIFEDRGHGLIPWVHPPAVNTVPPFDHSASPWVTAGTIVRSTPGGLVGPDGSTPADRYADNDTGSQAAVYRYTGAAGIFAHAGWRKDGASPPTAPGGALIYPSAVPSAVVEFEAGAAWSRWSGGSVALLQALEPAGLRAEGACRTTAETGEADFWGSQLIDGCPYDLPLIMGPSPHAAGASTDEGTLELSTTNIIRSGVLDLEVSFIAHQLDRQTPANDFDVFSLDSSDGDARFYHQASDGTWRLRVKGAGVIGALATCDALPKNHIVQARAWYRPGTSDVGIRVEMGGIVEAAAEYSGAISDTALAAATEAWVGSNLGASGFMGGQVRRVRSRPAGSSVLFLPKIMLIGDSTTASYQHRHNTAVGMLTVAEVLAGTRAISLAVVGNTIAQQKTLYNASIYKGQAQIEGIMIMLGANDVLAGASSGTILAALQDIIDTVAAGNPSALIAVALMSPAGAYFSAPQKAVWASVNAGIPSLTSVDAFMTSHATTLDDGSGNQQPRFDSGDGIHQNMPGARVIGAARRVTFQGLGVL